MRRYELIVKKRKKRASDMTEHARIIALKAAIERAIVALSQGNPTKAAEERLNEALRLDHVEKEELE